jgi:hypothetical protein
MNPNQPFNLFRFIKNLFGFDGHPQIPPPVPQPLHASKTKSESRLKPKIRPKFASGIELDTYEQSQHRQKIVNEKIDPSVVEQIILKQNLFSESMSKINSEPDCCVCLETNRTYIPLKCLHSLCEECYASMLGRHYKECPICMQPLNLMPIITSCAVMVHLSGFNIGVSYVPPIVDEHDDIVMADILNLGKITEAPLSKFLRLIRLRKYMIYFYDVVVADIIGASCDMSGFNIMPNNLT